MNPGVLAMLIPIAAIMCGTYIAVERMKQKRGGGADAEEALHRLDALEQELATVKEQLTETQERVDFTERLLAKQKDAGRLGPA
ncbi:MAG TPA: hypothetical protein VGI83_07680 [Gemmatimonadales bacterium]|jgi:lipase chaperone LimK